MGRCLGSNTVLSLALLLLALVVPDAPLRAGSPVLLELRIGDLTHAQVQAVGVRASIHHHGETQDVVIRAERVEVSGLEHPFTGLELECPQATGTWPAVRCRQGMLRVADSPWGQQEIDIGLDLRSGTEFELEWSGARFAGGRLRGDLRWSGDTWELQARAASIALGRVQPLLEAASAQGIGSLRGRVSLQVRAQGSTGGVQDLEVNGQVTGAGYEDSLGEQAGEGLGGRFRLAASPKGQGWSGSGDLRLEQGQLYSDPVFVDFARQPWRARGHGYLAGDRLQLRELVVEGDSLLQVKAEGMIDLQKASPGDFQLELVSDRLGDLYREILQPLAVATPLGNLEIEGDARAELRWEKGHPVSLDASIGRVDLEDGAGAFSLAGLTAALAWRARGEGPASRVAFEGGQLGQLQIGGSDFVFGLRDRFAWLLEPVRIPFYGGKIEIGDLSWVHTEEGPDVGFDLRIEQAALDGISTDLGWPLIRGMVSGSVPRARYQGGTLRVDGDLEVEAFDGRLVMQNVSLAELASAAPVFQADLELHRLDLYQLTQTFSFGEIHGRLDGRVEDMRLVNWEADRFDAHFYSTPDDDRKHRISQRAVDNLTALGNGVSGALSSSFLRFFESFSYDRIELKVRQEGERAWIDGLPAANGGYYLVRGAGIPRIDVIGRNREVGWKDLLKRLKAIRVQDVQVQ